jgi:hypothetical protein
VDRLSGGPVFFVGVGQSCIHLNFGQQSADGRHSQQNICHSAQFNSILTDTSSATRKNNRFITY